MKKLVLAMLLLCMVLALTACSCKHEKTEIANAVEPACTSEGYTGDIVCSKCKEVVSAGTAIPATGHTEGEVQNAVEPACITEGYTGDTFCTVCNEAVTTGEPIPATGHTEGELQNVVEPSCVNDGYTGDTFCTVCSEPMTKGAMVPMLAHEPAERSSVREVSCEEDGYTGDVYCTACSQLLERGDVIPAPGHVLSEPAGVVEATCLSDGYTGDATCSVCEKTLYGEVIAKLDHSYKNDVCTVCGWRTPGLYIAGVRQFTWEEVVANEYVKLREDNGGYELYSCSDGLSGELVIGEDVVSIYYGALMNSQLTGAWIPASCVEFGSGVFNGCRSLEQVVFFNSPDELPGDTFRFCTALTNVVLPENITAIGDNAFMNCESLQSVAIPDSVTKIGSQAFSSCTSLSEIKMPADLQTIGEWAFRFCESLTAVELYEGLNYIGNEAFADCTSLTTINLPEGLEFLGEWCFSGTAVTELTMPSTLTSLCGQSGMEDLVYADCSKMNVSEFITSDTFSNCISLETLILPDTMITLDDYALYGCSALHTLVLPEKLMTIDNENELEYCSSLKSIVWPVTLTDGSALACLPNLEVINYRGTEDQWNATSSKDLFTEYVVVNFEYAE